VYGVFILAAIAVFALSYVYSERIEGFVGGSGDTFTMYYVDWCGHCKKAKPIFTDFMGSGSVTVNGKQIKCKMVNPEQSPEAVKGLDIKGYPSFMLMKGGNLIEYNGPRTADGFMNFLKQNY
jgi:thiol-disulfide isomerase/thioredoxin